MTEPMRWEKVRWLPVRDFGSDLALTHRAIPFAHLRTEGDVRVFFAARDRQSRSRTFFSDFRPDDLYSEPVPTAIPALDLGELGAFDDSGAMPSWVMTDPHGTLRLYYTGWSLGKTVPFYFYVGLATSEDGGRTFRRYSRAPVLGRTVEDPFLTASPCVLFDGERYRMWYVSGVRWEPRPEGPRHYYHLRQAVSADGISWTAMGVAVDFASPDEYAFGRPCVVRVSDGFLMWYCVRGVRYRLGFAYSLDGWRWVRADSRVGITGGLAGCDDQMIAYAHVFSTAGRWWMLYNGNGYGLSGIGVATIARLPSVAELCQGAEGRC